MLQLDTLHVIKHFNFYHTTHIVHYTPESFHLCHFVNCVKMATTNILKFLGHHPWDQQCME